MKTLHLSHTNILVQESQKSLASFHQQASSLLLTFHADEEAGLRFETAVQRAQVAEAAAAGYECAAATAAAAAAAAVEKQVSSTIQKYQYQYMLILAVKKKLKD